MSTPGKQGRNAQVNAEEQCQLRTALYRPLLAVYRDARAKIVELIVALATR